MRERRSRDRLRPDARHDLFRGRTQRAGQRQCGRRCAYRGSRRRRTSAGRRLGHRPVGRSSAPVQILRVAAVSRGFDPSRPEHIPFFGTLLVALHTCTRTCACRARGGSVLDRSQPAALHLGDSSLSAGSVLALPAAVRDLAVALIAAYELAVLVIAGYGPLAQHTHWSLQARIVLELLSFSLIGRTVIVDDEDPHDFDCCVLRS